MNVYISVEFSKKQNLHISGLKRRALGLFKTSSTTALLHKIAKHCPEAAIISKKLQDIENLDPNRRSSSSSDSLTKPLFQKSQTVITPPSTLPQPKYLWIRLALFEKQLTKIIDFLVSNANKFYDKDALVTDPDYGSTLSSLLLGPCALDYSKTKTPDHFWTDPPANELVQRDRISSAQSTPPPVRRPILNIGRSLNTSSEETGTVRNSSQYFAKDYVASLHQNSRATLLYGKNNVKVFPANSDITVPMLGYLSLHQTPIGLIIKWTPNQLMNGFAEEVQDKSIYWEFALHVKLDEIVYVHCHQDQDAGGIIILVGQDGVQRPPIHFPKGDHMLAFLSCIETGLLPRGRLDPPLWTQRSGAQRKRRRPLTTLSEHEESNRDYVFRIIDNSLDKEILKVKRNELLDPNASLPEKIRTQLGSTSTTSSDSSTKSFSIDQNVPDSPPSVCIQTVCDSMRRQIISRAFYGWLAYCRHLSTVRRHLSGLVNSKIISSEGAEEGITLEKWKELCTDGVVSNHNEVYRLCYFGGIAQELRPELWPYLLGHHKFGSTKEQRHELDEETRQAYENTMSEWLAVEAIVRQRDKEVQAHAIAKLSSESMSGEAVPAPQLQRDLSNDVFEDISDDDYESNDEHDPAGKRTSRLKKTERNTIKYESDEDLEEKVDEGHEKDQTKFELDASERSVVDESEKKLEAEYNEKNAKKNARGTGTNSEIPAVDAHNGCNHDELKDFIHNVIVTNPSVDISNFSCEPDSPTRERDRLESVTEETTRNSSLDTCIETHGLASPARSACVSPASSNGGVYSQELLENFGLNLHRIEKDVQRCDRNYWYFSSNNLENLDKLRNVMCTYVWEHLDVGYVQGMCDLVAPLLVTFNDESLTYACFCHLMERMVENFPCGNAMDSHFANMRSLIQILDAEMYEMMHAQGDYTHFYFCYRWFLLDFKRELLYPDVYAFWETIWAAQQVASSHFVLFLALALLETYRDIILSNGMDFTDIIKFFNEMAERHDSRGVLKMARDFVLHLQVLIENK
ncbi:hypothetical protein WA026_019791 [Henosepilachna vigintioctopunctata]|uniref:Small G protein signaling modulator 1 n=1 Tax=Henosepilachna vigintioctopunctata TaxID=420089 RepID=A0AAW1VIM7_9CUCU